MKHWKFSMLFNLIVEKGTLFNFIYASNIICTHLQMITIDFKKKIKKKKLNKKKLCRVMEIERKS